MSLNRAAEGLRTAAHLQLIELEQVRVHDSRGSDDGEEAALLRAALR